MSIVFPSFQLCDRDNDGQLNDAELNEFQKLCFGIPLTAAAIEDVKRAVADGCPDGIIDEALSLPGLFTFPYDIFLYFSGAFRSWKPL